MSKYIMGHRTKTKKAFAALFIFLFLLIGSYVFLNVFMIKNITVDGSTHYTREEIIDMVMQKPEDKISLVLSMKYRNKSITDIAFIQSIEVDVISSDTIRIQVYEKALAGYIQHLGQYIYFDKDGIVVEASNQVTDGVPEITGLSFQSVVLYEPLPVANADIFTTILEITNLLNKYELKVDTIYFNRSRQATLYMGQVRIPLGEMDMLTEKIMKLRDLAPHLEGLRGVLHLENMESSSDVITFTQDLE